MLHVILKDQDSLEALIKRQLRERLVGLIAATLRVAVLLYDVEKDRIAEHSGDAVPEQFTPVTPCIQRNAVNGIYIKTNHEN